MNFNDLDNFYGNWILKPLAIAFLGFIAYAAFKGNGEAAGALVFIVFGLFMWQADNHAQKVRELKAEFEQELKRYR